MAQFSADASDFTADGGPNNLNMHSISAFARFEFEAGKGNDGTKILMVEWEDDALARSPVGSWHVSWDGKKTVLPADEQVNENDHTRRCYFLLPPGATIPPIISLTYEPPPSSAATVKKQDSIQINPLPAIYPPELGATARSAGKKGVLHTIWAKKRLQSLDKEIGAEEAYNPEGVALEMAMQEKEWIESNFGVGGYRPAALNQTDAPLSPSYTPVSPSGGKRLTDKLKGLKLETSEKDLTRRNTGRPFSLGRLYTYLVCTTCINFLNSIFTTRPEPPPPLARRARRRNILLQLIPQYHQHHHHHRYYFSPSIRPQVIRLATSPRAHQRSAAASTRRIRAVIHAICIDVKRRRRSLRKGPQSPVAGYPQESVFVLVRGDDTAGHGED